MLQFSTGGMSRNEGRRAWEDLLTRVCERPPELLYPDDFAASFRAHDLAGITIGRFMHNAPQLNISASSLRGSSNHERCIYLVLPLTDSRMVKQSKREVLIPTRALGVVDDALPYTYSYGRSADTIVARLPTAELLKVMPDGPALASRVHTYSIPTDRGLGSLLRATLLSIVRSADRFERCDAERARDTLIDLLRASMSPPSASQREQSEPLPEWRVRNYIEMRLADPELSPATIAAGCCVSVRQLHRIFGATQWSVSDWIRKRRLEHCRQELLDPAFDRLSITQIAFRWGFNDAAHFSKKFREAYKSTPRMARNHRIAAGATDGATQFS